MKRFLCVLMALLLLSGLAACSDSEKDAYKAATEAIEIEDYATALSLLATIPEYKDSAEIMAAIQPKYDYQQATLAMESGDYGKAAKLFEALGEYEDSAAQFAFAKDEGAFMLIARAVAKAIAHDSGFLPETYEIYQCGYKTASNGDPYAMVFGAQLTVYMMVTHDDPEDATKVLADHFVILIDRDGDARLMRNDGSLGDADNTYDTGLDVARLLAVLPDLIAKEKSK